MSVRFVAGSLLGAFAVASGLWLLNVQPDPPAGAKTATRRNRQIVGILQVVVGVFLIALSVSEI